jgi:hypothetical protein
MNERTFNFGDKVLVIDPSSEYYHQAGTIGWTSSTWVGPWIESNQKTSHAVCIDCYTYPWFSPDQLQLHP